MTTALERFFEALIRLEEAVTSAVDRLEDLLDVFDEDEGMEDV